ncbi:Phosphoribosylaminoimidazole carboxylase [Atractiella rhizophila]|nr:Phosphoribosylaminoimidazole carboxylase [Atractiella rhizophila]
MVSAASLLQIPVVVLDPSPSAPAKQISQPQLFSHASSSKLQHVDGRFTDASAIRSLASQVDVLTIEIEHVNVSSLKGVRDDKSSGRLGKGVEIRPSPEVIEVIQDKLMQKRWLRERNVPVSDFMAIESTSPSFEGAKQELVKSIAASVDAFGLPLMLKSRHLAYDGRGNYLIREASQIPKAVEALVSPSPETAFSDRLYAERFAPFVKEISVMVVRSASGEMKTYDPVETVHKDNICHVVFSPLRPPREHTGLDKGQDGRRKIGAALLSKAKAVGQSAITALGDGAIGVFAIEMFLMDDETILVNEIAPRPHNSYHHTIEASHTSQFANHIRAILGLPLGSVDAVAPSSAMLNILGMSSSLQDLSPLLQTALKTDGCHLHLYGKEGCRKGRKMGHITIVGQNDAEVKDRVKLLLATLPEDENEKNSTSTMKDLYTPLQPGFSHSSPLVAIIMGSDSDLPVMQAASNILSTFSVPYELSIVSAHRTPLRMVEFAETAAQRGIRVVIAGAGGAAHLPGMVAALTSLPVIGVPVKGSTLDGVDSLHSIVQMPRGIPVATVAINNSTNAALLAVRILSTSIPSLAVEMEGYMKKMEAEVFGKIEKLQQVGWEEYGKK